MKRILQLILFLSLFTNSLFAQNNQGIEMADGLRASGKIYVVLLVVVILFVGLFSYLLYVDKSLKKLEKNQ